MNYHEPQELLTQEDMDMHRILQSIIEEIEAVDWYYQRAAATENPLVRKFVLHNAHEEIEHALIGIEYLRRTSPVWSDMIDEYLYQDGELMEEYNEDGLEKEATMIKEALVEMGMEKISHYNWNKHDYLHVVDDEEEGIKGQVERGLENESVLEGFKKWKNNVKPRWDEFEREYKKDPKVQKFESLIEQAEGKRRFKLQKKLEEYIGNNYNSPIQSDGKMQGLKKKLERAKRKEYPNDRFTKPGKEAHSMNLQDKLIGPGMLAGGLIGAGATGAVMGSSPKTIPGKIAGGATGVVSGGIMGLLGGGAAGAGVGAATSPLLRPFTKNKSKYNKEGEIQKINRKLVDRDTYLRQGHNISY